MLRRDKVSKQMDLVAQRHITANWRARRVLACTATSTSTPPPAEDIQVCSDPGTLVQQRQRGVSNLLLFFF